MQKLEKTHTAPRSTGATPDCCTELTCESGLRNHYFEGKRLTPDMFRVEQQYLNERRWLLNRAIHGHGVVYGYAIGLRGTSGRTDQASTWLQIGRGLALDECGRELLHGGHEVAMNDLIALDDRERRIDLDTLLTPPKSSGGSDDGKTCWLLSAHHAEQHTSPVTLKDPCRCDRDEHDHVCETVRFSLRRIPCDECCAGCGCELTCQCASDACCTDPAEGHAPFQRGGRCLCDHLTGLEFPDCAGRLCEIDEPCARVWVDLGHGVALACVEIVADDCGGWTIGEIDACGPRRLVKRNDVLFDLVRGCDLTFISDFGWKTWHRRLTGEPPRPAAVTFEEFAKAIAPPPDDHEQYEYVTAAFWVKFSRPVRKDTLDTDCFSFTVLSVEREGKWRGVQRVPITRLEYIPTQPNDPVGHVRGAYLVVDGGWVEDGLWGRGSVFYEDTWVEIEVRGDYILDCNGQPVDANAVGRVTHRSGNGTPGGTFLSTFQVGPRPPYKSTPPPTPPDKSYPAKGAAS